MVDAAALATLADGVTIDGVRYGSVKATLDRQQRDNAWLTMSLTEGKNREIRKLCEHFGWRVNRLIRDRLRAVPARRARTRRGRGGDAARCCASSSALRDRAPR